MMRSLARFQWFAALPLVVVLTGFLIFWELVHFAATTNFVLNGIILGVMMTGVVIMHAQIFRLRGEWGRLNVFYRRVTNGEEIGVVLEDPGIQDSEVGRVLSHISSGPLSVGNRSVQAAVESQLDALAGILDSRQELAQFLVGFMIALGLLGTFIGILETLTHIGSLMTSFTGTDFSRGDVMGSFIAELAKPMRGMGTAFSASMFGLIGSLCLGLTMVAVRRSATELVNDVRDVISRTTTIPSFDSQGLGAGADFQFLTGFLADLLGQQRESVAMFQQGMEDNARVVRSVDSLGTKMLNLCSAIEQQQSSMTEASALLRENPVLRQVTDQFLSEVKVLASTSAENSANLSALIPALTGVTQKLASFMDVLLHQREQIQSTLSTVAESHGLLQAGVLSAFDHEARVRASTLDELSQVRKLMLEIRPAASAAAPMVSEINHRLNEQLFALNELQESLRYMTQAVAQSFSGIKGGIAEMLVDGQKNREVQTQAIAKIISMQEMSAQFQVIHQSLKQLTEGSANDVAASRLLLDEMRGMKGGILRELRLDMREWEMRRDMRQRTEAKSGAEETRQA